MDVIGLIKYISLPTIAVLFLLWVIKNPEKIQIWVSILQRIYAWASKDNQKRAISNEIEGKLNLYSRKINTEFGIDEIMPYRAKIYWIEDSEEEINRETFIKGEHVVIKMTYHQNREKNITLSTLDYVSKGLVPRGRMYVNNKVMKSIDLKMTYKILNMGGSYSEIEYFLDNILPHWLKDPEIESFYEKMHPIEERGFFIAVLLNEILILGKIIPLGDESKRKRAIAETKDFVIFLYNIATKKTKEEVELSFLRKEIRVGIILIAREEIRERLGEEPYLRRFKRYIEDRCERVYVFSMTRNIPFAKQVIREIEQKEERGQKITGKDINVTTIKGKPIKGFFSLFQIQT